MKAKHVTSDYAYRSVYGACERGCSVTLALDTWEGMARSVDLRVWQEGKGESLFAMQVCELASAPDGAPCPCKRFTVDYTPDTLGVVWYSFRIVSCDGALVWYGAEEGWTSGSGMLYDHEPPSFQMTIFDVARPVPAWYREGIVYQIFPDRFARDASWPENVDRALEEPRRGPARVRVDEWMSPVAYKKTPDGDIAEWEFFGGSLRGIEEKLDYLSDLGATVLYLNPIFEAASNHRYDTADYLAIDPMLGTCEDFERLCVKAAERGISIILDGVFNHSGQDSRYFNAYCNYSDIGAAQSADSPYRSWYRFNDDGSYAAWWGVKDLPEYNEDDASLREFFCGENGVIRTWIRAGAKGWRLDVADELPDSFIEDIRCAALAENPEAVVIGEVWEDASNKYAYGKLRHYFQGTELDGAMNYPFRKTVIDFLTGAIGATTACRLFEQLAENYPAENLAACLNLLGSHDRERIFTLLGDAPTADSLSEGERGAYRLSEAQRELAFNRLKLALLLQMTAPGVPSVYYGDEVALDGYADPYNRAPMNWDDIYGCCYGLYRDAIALRRALPLLATGAFEPVSFGEEVLGWWRSDAEAGESACVLVNRSPWDWAHVRLEARGECASELARATEARIVDGFVELDLAPFESSVVYFHARERMQKQMGAGTGIIAHITSIPNETDAGTLGAPAKRFIDWLANQGYAYWQTLPVNPTDEYGSPYAGLSAFAGNERLVEWPDDAEAYLAELAREPGFVRYCAENEAWLKPYAAFKACKKKFGAGPWQSWPEEFRTDVASVAAIPEFAEEIARQKAIQYAFDTQWRDLKRYANERGIAIIGDIPMYVSADSADVWANPDQFALDADFGVGVQAGVPPDALASEGQTWGNPTYRWDVMRADGFAWWKARMQRMLALFDYVRLDHFLGFGSYFTIPEGADALHGHWVYGPGIEFFGELQSALGGKLPLIAENLGTITPAVRALVARAGFPGMDVIQFNDGDVRAGYAPVDNAIAYMGTHDTQTLVGWCETKFKLSREEAIDLASQLMARTIAQESGVVMLQLQDALLLGDEARMNVPSVAAGNWAWQAPLSLYE